MSSPVTDTASFVEKLFRSLESESYIKGEDPPPQSPPTSAGGNSNPASKPSTVLSPSPVLSSKSDNSDRRQSEDVRHKEVRETGVKTARGGGEIEMAVCEGGIPLYA